MQRDLSALRREHKELSQIRVDDLDEDTRVINDPQVADPGAHADAWGGGTGPSADSTETMAEAGLSLRDASVPARAESAGIGADLDDTSGNDAAHDHAPTGRRGATRTTSRQPPAALPSVRVAVLGTAVPGEVRLVLLDDHSEPPTGAATAILVPLSAGDGEAIARLFTGTA